MIDSRVFASRRRTETSFFSSDVTACGAIKGAVANSKPGQRPPGDGPLSNHKYLPPEQVGIRIGSLVSAPVPQPEFAGDV